MRLSKLIRTTADILFPFILVFGLYIILHGHLTPGGGFQGGAVIATAFVLLLVSYRLEDFLSWFRKDSFQNSEITGLVLFVGMAMAALGLGLAFFTNFLADTGGIFGTIVSYGVNSGSLNTGGVIPIMNMAVGIEVLGGLSLIILYMMTGLRQIEEAE